MIANIICDSNETNSGIIDLLRTSPVLNVEQRRLNIGDYQLSEDICLERKTPLDLWASVKDGRLFRQLVELKQNFSKPAIILEGDLRGAVENNYVDYNVLRSVLLSIALDYQVPIIPSFDEHDTMRHIKRAVQRLNRPKNKVIPLQTRPKPKDPMELEQFIWESFPMIGPVLAKDLTNIPGSLLEKLNTLEDLSVPKFGPKKKKACLKVLHGRG